MFGLSHTTHNGHVPTFGQPYAGTFTAPIGCSVRLEASATLMARFIARGWSASQVAAYVDSPPQHGSAWRNRLRPIPTEKFAQLVARLAQLERL
jgi:hypothetical protein